MKAECTWGDGPDVLVILDGTGLMLYEDPHNDPPPRGQCTHGRVTEGSLDLTAAEAENLGIELITAAKQARDMDRLCKEADGAAEKTIKWKDISPCDKPECKGGIGPHTRDECP